MEQPRNQSSHIVKLPVRHHEGEISRRDRNIAITTRLVDTAAIPMLLKLVASGKLQPAKLVTHRFALADMMKAYDTFGNAAKEHALKVILTSPECQG